MNTERFARQILAFGEEGHQKISASNVGIVGLGGVGSQVAQALAYLGVGSFTLVDDDRVDMTNLNRLVGAYPIDAESKTLKVDIAGKHILQINPQATVSFIPKNLRSIEALEALISCSNIFGCVDHDAPRLILTELAAAYRLNLIDSGVEILLENRELVEYGGRVVLARPGDYCLDCARQIDMEQAKMELEPSENREIRQRHGYGLGENAPSPAVISLNGVIANLAVTEFIALITGMREPNRHLTYYGLRGKVNVRDDKRRIDCFTCGYIAGLREKANIFRYCLA